jgi:hypothetical protein
VTETAGSVGGGGAGAGGTAVETTTEVGGTTTGGGGAGAAAQAGTLANTGHALGQQASKTPLALDGLALGLLSLVAAAWLKRRELFGRWLR